MNLDDLDLAGLPERVVTEARRDTGALNDGWVVRLDGARGLLLDTDRGLSWFFDVTLLSLPWPSVEDTVALSETDVMVLRSGGEAYRFAFGDAAQRARFLETVGRRRASPPVPAYDAGSDARGALAGMFMVGLLLVVVGAAIVAVADLPLFGWFVLVLGQIGLCIGIVGWGVMLGIRAARES